MALASGTMMTKKVRVPLELFIQGDSVAYKILDASTLTVKGEGAYGCYSVIKGTKFGVKVDTGYNNEFSTLDEAKKSYAYRAVCKEFKRLKKLNKITTLTPKAQYVAIVKGTDGEGMTCYSCGYVMTHIEGRTASESNLSQKDWNRLQQSRYRLKRKGIHQIDAHGGNVMVVKKGKKKRFIFIDAGGLRFKEDDNCDWS